MVSAITFEHAASAAIQTGIRKTATETGKLGLSGIGVAVLSSAINKSAGATNRLNDVKNEPKYVKDYVLRRELMNIAYSILANTMVQVFLHKPVTKLLRGKIPEGYVRMLLTAPGLYLSEYLSRLTAGKNKVEQRQARDKGLAQSAIRRASNVSFAAFSPTTSTSDKKLAFNASI
jgi:hypothetical protein